MVGDDDHILMQVWDPDLYANTLQKVNIHTGKGELHERGSERTRFWYTQNGVAVLRVDQSELGRYTRLSARPPGARDWQFVRKIRSNDFSQFDDFEAVGATDEAGVLLVATMAPGDDARTIRRFDIRTLALGEVVASHAGRDMEGVFFDKGLNPVAAAYTENRTQYEFLDAALAPHYRAVQNALGADANVLLHDMCCCTISTPAGAGSLSTLRGPGSPAPSISMTGRPARSTCWAGRSHGCQRSGWLRWRS